jgi:hypothetical protein
VEVDAGRMGNGIYGPAAFEPARISSQPAGAGIPEYDSRPQETPIPRIRPEQITGAIEAGLREWFNSDDSRKSFVVATEQAETGVKWLKWGITLIVVIFGAGVGYSQWVADNATQGDISRHIKNDLIPVRDDVSSVKVSVDMLVKAEGKRAELELEQREYTKKIRLLEAHRAEYQEAMAEYTATKAAGRRAERPRKTAEHVALEARLGITDLAH